MDSELIKKLDAALDSLMNSKNGVKVGDWVIDRKENGRLRVLGFSKYSNDSSYSTALSKETKPEFETIKADFIALYEESARFKQVVNRADIDYYLQYDYGMGSVTLCKEEKGVFEYTKIT